MKKLLSALLALTFLFTLGACSSKPTEPVIPVASEDVNPTENVDDYDFYVKGDEVQTTFFKWTVNSAEFVDEYEGVTASAGKKLVCVNVTVKNTEDYTLPMFGDDFQFQWGGEGDGDFAYAVAGELSAETYEIGIGETVTGDLVFEAPEDAKDCSLSYLEIYSNGETGDVYFIYFSVK